MQPKSGAPGSADVLSETAWRHHALLFFGMWMIAGYFVMGRAIHADIPAIGLVFWHSLIGAAVIAVFFWRSLAKERHSLLAHWRLLLLLGILQGIVGHVCVLYGLQSTTAVNAGLISATQPALTACTAWLILRHTLSARQILGLVIAVLGVLPIISRGDVGVLLALDFRIGDLLLQVAMVSFAFYNTLVKRAAEHLSPFSTLFAILFATAISTVPLYGWEIAFSEQQMTLNWVTIASVAYFAIVATVIALAFINMGIARLGPTRAGSYFFLMPAFTSLLAVVLLGEEFRLYHVVGLIVVTIGVSMVSLRSRVPNARG
ncbi:MAG: DMT family transporter [Proteobacteria bacterium]|nr:DMT family transporter [Pseudomonadota bacterium]